MAEMHPVRVQGLDPAQRVPPGRQVAGLAGRQPLAGQRTGVSVHPRGVGRVADQQVEGFAVAAYEHALVARRVPGGGDDLQAGQHLGVPVQQFEPSVHEAEPVPQFR